MKAPQQKILGSVAGLGLLGWAILRSLSPESPALETDGPGALRAERSSLAVETKSKVDADPKTVAGTSTSKRPRTLASPALDRTIERALDYLVDPTIRNESFVFNVLYFLERRFELGRFEDMPERHAAFLAALPQNLPQKSLFRRVIEPDYVATPEEIAAAEDPVDKLTTQALYCQHYPLKPGFARQLRALAVKGDYATTHAAMAIQWSRENDCGSLDASIEEYVVDQLAWGIRAGDDTSDLEIERAAFLAYLGHRDRVAKGYAGDLMRLQRKDGGWAIEPGGASNWHPTFLALWYLLETRGDGNGASMIVPSKAAE